MGTVTEIIPEVFIIKINVEIMETDPYRIFGKTFKESLQNGRKLKLLSTNI